MTPYINRGLLQSIHYSPLQGLTYVPNQKAGSSTIKNTLWRDHDARTGTRTLGARVHNRARSPFLTDTQAIRAHGLADFMASSFFTVVRNPFTRALSAYLHQVDNRGYGARLRHAWFAARGKRTWHHLRRQYGISPFDPLTFEDFLTLIDSDLAVNLRPHFRPQVINILTGFVGYDFIGQLEDPAALADYFHARGMTLEKRTSHARHAGSKLPDYYSERAIELVRAIYAEDFALLGYSTDLTDVGDVAPTRLDGSRHILDQVMTCYARRDRAQSLERLEALFPDHPYWLDLIRFQQAKAAGDDAAALIAGRAVLASETRDANANAQILPFLAAQGGNQI